MNSKTRTKDRTPAPLTRSDLLLALLASADGGRFTPVQLQKALFLLSRNATTLQLTDGHYQFKPYHYGPFAVEVYEDAEQLQKQGMVEIIPGPRQRFRYYVASESGTALGQQILDSMENSDASYLMEMCVWVRKQTFEELVKSIYASYPDMEINTRFKTGSPEDVPGKFIMSELEIDEHYKERAEFLLEASQRDGKPSNLDSLSHLMFFLSSKQPQQEPVMCVSRNGNYTLTWEDAVSMAYLEFKNEGMVGCYARNGHGEEGGDFSDGDQIVDFISRVTSDAVTFAP